MHFLVNNIIVIMISFNSPNNNHLIFLMAPPSKIRNGQEQPKQQSYLFQTSPHVEKCTDMYGYATLCLCLVRKDGLAV